MSLCSSQGLYVNVIMLKSMFIYKCHYAQINVFIYKCHYAQVNVYIYKCHYAQIKVYI